MAIELESAVGIILNNIKPIQREIDVDLEKSNRYILSQNIYATINQPPFNRSPLDGYALYSEDTKNASLENPIKLKVIEEVFAGGYPKKELISGFATRIMTGAPIPDSADCIIRQEDTDYGMEEVSIYKSLKPYQNYCFIGEDRKKDSLLCEKGTKLNFMSMAVLSSQGIKKVKVYDKSKVLLITTGDELLYITEELKQGKIFNSNLYALQQRLIDLGCDVTSLHMGDNYDKIVDLIKSEYHKYDLILSTGGVSVGKKDILHDVYEKLGCEKIFWKVKLKPGTPAMFTVYNDTPILSLSGNPFASIATFELLARPLLSKLNNDNTIALKYKKAKMLNEFLKESPSRRFIRAMYEDGNVTLEVNNHSSGSIGNMINVNCLIDIPSGNKGLTVGDTVDVVLF